MATDDRSPPPETGYDPFKLSRRAPPAGVRNDLGSQHDTPSAPRALGRERLGMMSEEPSAHHGRDARSAHVQAGERLKQPAHNGRVKRWVDRIAQQGRNAQPESALDGDLVATPPFIPPRRQRASQSGLTGFAQSDKMSRILIYGAGSIGAILALIVGVRSLLDGHRGEIAIIAPPALPVRERPADPGGLQVLNTIPENLTDFKTGQARLAPGPEQPKLSALSARAPGATLPNTPAGPQPSGLQVDTVRKSDTQSLSHSTEFTSLGLDAVSTQADAHQNSGASSPVARPSGKVGDDLANASPVTSASNAPVANVADPGGQSRAEVVNDAAASPFASVVSRGKVIVSTAPPLGQSYIQLGAVKQETEAQAKWARIAQRMRGQLSNRPVFIVPKLIRGRILYRIWVGGFPSEVAAAAACADIKASRIPCYAVRR